MGNFRPLLTFLVWHPNAFCVDKAVNYMGPFNRQVLANRTLVSNAHLFISREIDINMIPVRIPYIDLDNVERGNVKALELITL
jgi:hypothetical protein